MYEPSRIKYLPHNYLASPQKSACDLSVESALNKTECDTSSLFQPCLLMSLCTLNIHATALKENSNDLDSYSAAFMENSVTVCISFGSKYNLYYLIEEQDEVDGKAHEQSQETEVVEVASQVVLERKRMKNSITHCFTLSRTKVRTLQNESILRWLTTILVRKTSKIAKIVDMKAGDSSLG